jgi:hypothetical protein
VDENILFFIERNQDEYAISSQSDPCIFYKHKEGKFVLLLVLYVDDTLCAGEKEEVEWAYKIGESELKMWYNWKNIFGSLHAEDGERDL